MSTEEHSQAYERLKTFQSAYFRAREFFLKQDDVIGVTREFVADENLSAIVVLVRKGSSDSTTAVSYPSFFEEFRVVVREPDLEAPIEPFKLGRREADLSAIDWVKVHRMRERAGESLTPPHILKALGPVVTTQVGQVFVIQDPRLPTTVAGFPASDIAMAFGDFLPPWKDDYDFIAMYLDVPSGMPSPDHFNHIVYNPVNGINHQYKDYNAHRESPEYDSTSRLLSIQVFPYDPSQALNWRYLRLHEIAHQWGAYVENTAPTHPTQALPDLLQAGNPIHWGGKFDCDYSSLSEPQFDWIQTGPRTFIEDWPQTPRSNYCPLDLYLMGMIGPTDNRLTNMYFIDNLWPAPGRGAGASHDGDPVNISINNIIDVHHNREPSADLSPRSFRQAFVLLTTDLNLGEDPAKTGVLLAQLIDDQRLAHGREFRKSVESRGMLDTYLYRDSYDGVYIRDHVNDTGADNNQDVNIPSPMVPFWDSPDIWVRNQNDGGTVHQDTKKGQDNWVYVKVRNNGSQNSNEITVNLFVANFAGLEFLYPEDWRVEHLLGSQIVPGPVGVPANGEVLVKFLWPWHKILSTISHPCLLVEILPIHRVKRKLRHVWDDRRLAQKNITILPWEPVSSVSFKKNRPFFPFSIGSRSLSARWTFVRIRQLDGEPIGKAALQVSKADWLGRIEKVGPLEHMNVQSGATSEAILSQCTRGASLINTEDYLRFAISDISQGCELALPLLDGERRELLLDLTDYVEHLQADVTLEITQLDKEKKIVGGLYCVFKTPEA